MNLRPAKPLWLNRRERPYDLRAQPMISLAAAATLGILADRAALLTVAGGLVAIGLLALIVATLWNRERFNHRNGWVAVMFAVAFAGWLHSRTEQRRYDAATIRNIITEEDQPILLRATIRSDIQRRPSLKPSYDRPGNQGIEAPASVNWQTRFIADVTRVRYGADWQAFEGGVYVTIDDDFPALSPGDLLQIGGNISSFSPPTNPGESDFRVTARNRHLHARLFVDSTTQVKVLQSGFLGIRRAADSLARSGEETLQSILSSDSGPLASALVIGRRGSLDSQVKDRLLETGTIHLLSVSGLHLGIVATVVLSFGIFAGMGRRSLVAFVGLSCFAFAAITGGNPPVLRAAILVATMLTALVLNRRQWPLNTLAFAALILVWLNPTNVEQVGVQLSFISVATLICCTRAMDPAEAAIAESFDAQAQLEGLVDKTRSPRDLWLRRKLRHVQQIAWLSLCVTLTTLPLTWLQFNIISPIAVIANLLLSLPAAIALIAGLLAVIGGWIWQPLAIIPGLVCDAVLRLMVLIIDMASGVPLGHAWLPSPPSWWVVIYFLLLIGSFAIKRPFNRPRAFVVGSIAWGLIAWVLAVSPSWKVRDSLVATFIDVGHGTSVLLEMPGGENYLYDCGRLGNYESTSRGVEEVLWSRGLTYLDAVIVSHADADHYNSLPGLLQRFAVGEVITPPGLFDDEAPALALIRDQLDEQDISIRELSIEDGSLHGDGVVKILHPPKVRLPGSDNANSLVLRIDDRGRSFLLPGDLEPPGTELVTNGPRPIAGGVMMAPHHGSLTAKTQSMLDWARPAEVIVSGGPRAKNPKVETLLQARGSRVFVTSKHGAVKVAMDRSQIQVQGFLKSQW